MGYIVATSGFDNTSGIDQHCGSYAEACAIVKAIRQNGGGAVIVDADAEWCYWNVWKDGLTVPHVVSARTADEALMVARAITGDRDLDTVLRRTGRVSIEVTRPDGTADVIEAFGTVEAEKYVQRYTARGWNARII